MCQCFETCMNWWVDINTADNPHVPVVKKSETKQLLASAKPVFLVVTEWEWQFYKGIERIPSFSLNIKNKQKY